eukprot:m.391491 g.391491  ORF g.391491 m.391491 type:complete len:677 (-) comp28316_c0_seq11:3052-5082(-)
MQPFFQLSSSCSRSSSFFSSLHSQLTVDVTVSVFQPIFDMPSTTQILRFSSTAGNDPAAEKGPPRSRAGLERMARMLDPAGDSGGLKLGKGATTHLRSHDGVKLGSARTDKVLGYLASFIGVEAPEIHEALTFGGTAPTAALAKMAFVLALELQDAETVPTVVPADFLVGYEPGTPPVDPPTSNRAELELEREKLRAAKASMGELGIELAESALSRLVELEAELATTEEEEGEEGAAATAGLETLPGDPAVDPIAHLRKDMDKKLAVLHELLADIAGPRTGGETRGAATDTAQRDATIAARAAVRAAEAERDHFQTVNAEVPAATLKRLDEATKRLAATKALRRENQRVRWGGDDLQSEWDVRRATTGRSDDVRSELERLDERYAFEAARLKRKYDGAEQLRRDVMGIADAGGLVQMSDFGIISGWSANTRKKLALGTFMEFPKLHKELQEGSRTVRTRVRVDDGQLVVDNEDGAATSGADTFTPMEHLAHTQVFNAWLRLLRQVHASNSRVLRDLNRLEVRILGYAQSYPGHGYQQYLRVVRQRMAQVADIGSSLGTHLSLSFGDADPDLFMRVFGSPITGGGGTGTASGGPTAHPDRKRGATDTGASTPSPNICFAFDKDRCTRDPCSFTHACSICGGSHSKKVCPSKTGTGTAAASSPGRQGKRGRGSGNAAP